MESIEEKYKKEIDPNKYYITNIKVRWEEMDINGHVNYASYLDYYSEGRIEALGHDVVNNLRKNGIGPVIYKAELDFNRELFHPDTAHVVTWVDEIISKTRVAVKQRIYSFNNQELISNAKFFAIFMDLNKRKPVRIPDQVNEKFQLV